MAIIDWLVDNCPPQWREERREEATTTLQGEWWPKWGREKTNEDNKIIGKVQFYNTIMRKIVCRSVEACMHITIFRLHSLFARLPRLYPPMFTSLVLRHEIDHIVLSVGAQPLSPSALERPWTASVLHWSEHLPFIRDISKSGFVPPTVPHKRVLSLECHLTCGHISSRLNLTHTWRALEMLIIRNVLDSSIKEEKLGEVPGTFLIFFAQPFLTEYSLPNRSNT